MFNYWIRSLSVRLWVTTVGALALSLTVLAAIVVYTFGHSPPERFQVKSDMRTVGRVAAGLQFDTSDHPVSVNLAGQTRWLFQVVPTELMYQVFDDAGHIVLTSADPHSRAPWDAGNPAAAAGSIRYLSIDHRPFDVATLRIEHDGMHFVVKSAISEAFNRAVLGERVDRLPGTVAVTVLIATIVFALTLTLTVRRVLRPLREASRAAASITPQNLRTRLSEKGVPSEIKPLLAAFNAALARLENGFTVQQQFLASAAHELQTPLTLMRGQIELQSDLENKELLFREIDMMARQVRQLLHLAEVSEAQNFNFIEVDRLDVAQDVVGYLARKADQKQVKLQVDAAAEMPTINADRSGLFILLKNLVENAINATSPGGSVFVSIDPHSIQVRDEGPGIRADYLPFLFERFWRAPDVQHDGAGLGLAICREIAVAHHWRLSVEPLSKGTRFVLSF